MIATRSNATDQSKDSPEHEVVFVPERSAGERRIALLVFVASLLYLRLFYVFTTFHADEGIVLEGAQRILQGQVVYRDFFSFYTPGSFYWMALLFKVFGSSILVGRAALMVYGGFYSVLTYLLARRICSRWSALFAAYLVTLTCVPYRFMVLHNWDSTLVAYLALYCAVWFLQEAHWAWAFGAGSFTAFTCLVEQSKGGGLVLGLVVGFLVIRLSHRHTTLWDRAGKAALAVGFAWPFLLTLAYFGSQHSLPQALADWFWPLRHYLTFHAPPSGYSYASVNELPFGYSPLYDQVCRALHGERVSWNLIIFLMSAPFLIVSLLPWVALGFLGLNSAEAWRANQCTDRRAYTILVSATLSGLLLGLLVARRADFIHITFLGPLFFLVLAWVVDPWDMNSSLGRSLRVAGTVLLFFVFTVFGVSMLARSLGASYETATRRGILKSPEPDKMLEYVQAHLSPGERIFVYPPHALYCYLTATLNPTSYDLLQLGMFTPDQFQEAVRQLASDRTRVVLFEPSINEKWALWFPATPPSVLAARDPVADYILLHYRPCARALPSPLDWRFVYMVRKDLNCPDRSILLLGE